MPLHVVEPFVFGVFRIFFFGIFCFVLFCFVLGFFLYSMLCYFISWILLKIKTSSPKQHYLGFFFLFIWNVIKMNFFKSILNFLNLSQREIHTDNLSYFDLHEFQFTGFSLSGMECKNLYQNFFFFLSFSNRSIPLSFIYLEFFLSYQCFTIHRIQGRQVQCRYISVMLNYLISWQDYYIMHVRFFREGSRL